MRASNRALFTSFGANSGSFPSGMGVRGGLAGAFPIVCLRDFMERSLSRASRALGRLESRLMGPEPYRWGDWPEPDPEDERFAWRAFGVAVGLLFLFSFAPLPF